MPSAAARSKTSSCATSASAGWVAVLTIDFRDEGGAKGDFRPVVRNLKLEHVTSSATPPALRVRGIPNGIIEEIRAKNCQFNDLTEPEVVEHAGIITFANVTLTPEENSEGLELRAEPEGKK